MEFLYPTSRQFPFDQVCEQIVRELELRNWSVPGMTVEFDSYGSGDQKMILVRRVKGEDFQIHFGRPQGPMPGGRYNNTAAVNDINIPHRELRVYDNESGPTLYLYVGSDWNKDRQKFMNGFKVNSKLNKEPKMYLEYQGGCNCRSTGGASFEAIGFLMSHINNDTEALAQMNHTHPGRRPPLLVHTNDLGREYDPEGEEPKWFKTKAVMDDFREYLADVVLKAIMSHPIPTEKIDMLAVSPPTPFPDSVGSIFCFGDHRDAERIKQGQAYAGQLPAAERYGLSSGGMRVMSLGTPNDGTVPEIAYDGFLWCGLQVVSPETEIEKLEVPGHYRWSDRERFIIRIKPKSADSIYIADHAPYEKRRKELGEAMEEGRDRFTDAEVADFTRAWARTLIPIIDYTGGFEQPVILINRELSFDEVEVVSGPHNERHHR